MEQIQNKAAIILGSAGNVAQVYLVELLLELLKSVPPNSEVTQYPAFKNDSMEGDQEVLLTYTIEGISYTLLRGDSPPVDDEKTKLSPREMEIVHLVAKGYPNKTIAAVLEISPWTVATHLRRIYGKLHVNTRTEMVARMMNSGLVVYE